ncbi:MAG: metallophosphoesterase family protein [Armatimonadota bacterium]
MKTLRTIVVAWVIVLLAASLLPAQLEVPQHEAPGQDVERDEAREDLREQLFTFAVFADAQPYGRQFTPELVEIATRVGRSDVAFVIGAGDYIDGSSNQATVRRQWNNFFTALAPLQAMREIPVALAPGNHDISGVRRNAEIFCEHFDRLYFSFDYQGCHFVVLDSETIGADARVTGKQLEWLKQDLADARDAKFTFVAMHRPLFPVDGNIGYSLDKHPKERDALHALFVESGVNAVFHGHEHLYHHQERDGIHYFITGGAGAKPYVEPENGGFHHYLLVSVEDDGFVVEVQRVSPSEPTN